MIINKRFLSLFLCISLIAFEKPYANDEELSETEMRQLSQAFGHFIGRNLKTTGIKFDLESVIKGIRNGASEKKPPMSEEDYQQKMSLLQAQAYRKLVEINLNAANTFLNENAKNPQIIEIEVGKLQYETLEEGQGKAVAKKDTPVIHYTGKFMDGKVFGSSKDSGGPITTPLSHTIPGFSKGIVGMKEGEVRRLYIHPDLGYGTTGHLPPNSLLIFDIELVQAEAPKDDNKEEDEDNEEVEEVKESEGWWPWK